MILQLKNICKKFDAPIGDKSVTVLNDLSFDVKEGESIAIVGPSGSGKSTLLNIIGALDNPSSGKILFDEEDLSELNDNKLSMIRNEKIGFVFQLHHLLQQCTVLENVLIPTIPINTNRTERAKELLTKVGLKEHLNHYPAHLSGGELQRVAVVRALINEPKILLADEPTGSLDQRNSIELVKLLLELNKNENVTVIMVTHSTEIAKLMDKTFLLQNGNLSQTE